MVTYDFYRDIYLGSALSEEAFPQAAARAEAWIQKLERTCQVEAVGQDSRELAVCAVAETLSRSARQQNVAQTTVGGVSVRYEGNQKLQRQLLQNASVFLDIRRGVSA